jgi:hypothetical protein
MRLRGCVSGDGYFESIGTKIVKGRGITEQDTSSTRNVAVINQTFARKFFKDKDEDPIDWARHVQKSEASWLNESAPDCAKQMEDDKSKTIATSRIGRNNSMKDDPIEARPAVYWPRRTGRRPSADRTEST